MKNDHLRARSGSRLLAALLLLSLVSAGPAVGAYETDGTPSELEARWPADLGETFIEEQVIVRSLRTSEDRLFVNDEPFVLTHQSSIVDERGRRLLPGGIWVGWLVELCYRAGQKSEADAHGPEEKVLVRMRVIQRLSNTDEQLE
jgi:hypothetical protein